MLQAEVVRVDRPYYCPQCRSNRMSFRLFYRLVQPVRKDPYTGAVIEAAPGPRPAVPEEAGLEVQCPVCNFRAPESIFVAAAAREPAEMVDRPGF